MSESAFSGPVDYVVFAFDQGADLADGLRALLRQVEAGAIELLDLEVVYRDPSTGQPVRGTLDAVSESTSLDLSVFAGAESNILDDDDLAAVAAELSEHQFALVVIYEDRALASAAASWAKVGGTELLTGGVTIADLELALREGASA